MTLRFPAKAALPLLLTIAACGTPPPEEAADESVDPADLTQELGVTCVGTQACSGNGNVYRSVYRVGAGPKATGELVQTFVATGTLAPAKLFLVARNLRPIPAGATPHLRVALYGPVTGAVAAFDFDTATAIASGSTLVSSIAATGQTSIALTSSGSLQQGAAYALRITVDGVGSPGTKTVLVGLGAIVNSQYAPGAAWRRTRHAATAWGQLGVPLVTAAGTWDVGFATSGDSGSACEGPADCSAGLSCNGGTCGSSVDDASCQTILATGGSTGSGTYTLADATSVWCDMATDAGGWTRVVHFKRGDVPWNAFTTSQNTAELASAAPVASTGLAMNTRLGGNGEGAEVMFKRDGVQTGKIFTGVNLADAFNPAFSDQVAFDYAFATRLAGQPPSSYVTCDTTFGLWHRNGLWHWSFAHDNSVVDDCATYWSGNTFLLHGSLGDQLYGLAPGTDADESWSAFEVYVR